MPQDMTSLSAGHIEGLHGLENLAILSKNTLIGSGKIFDLILCSWTLFWGPARCRGTSFPAVNR